MFESARHDLTTILHEKLEIPYPAIEDTLAEVQHQIDLAFCGENPYYETPAHVLDDFFIPANYLWAFCN